MTIRAAIDIGTNTSHIIIASLHQGHLKKILYRKRYYTYIAMDGIEHISASAQARLYEAMHHFREVMDEYQVESVRAVGTEALRSANNGQEILDHISTNYVVNIEIVSGEREAQLIFQGVSQIIDLADKSSVIIDIGGGSVEFIQVVSGTVVKLDSLPIGIARLYKQFHLSDPITAYQIDHIYDHLNIHCGKLINGLPDGTAVIGSAGTFEVLVKADSHQQIGTISRQQFSKFYDQIVNLDLEARNNSDMFPPERARYIVTALILVRYLFEATGCKEMVVSPYALKEGLIVDF